MSKGVKKLNVHMQDFFKNPEVIRDSSSELKVKPIVKLNIYTSLFITWLKTILLGVKNKRKDILFEFTDRFKTNLIEIGYDRSYGPRLLRRAMTRLLNYLLSEGLIYERIKSGHTFILDFKDGEVKFYKNGDFDNLE